MISVIENILQFELPGSGKTRVLLWRTLNLIVFHNLQPNEIFLATFTEKAALQLKEGLQGLLSIASKYPLLCDSVQRKQGRSSVSNLT